MRPHSDWLVVALVGTTPVLVACDPVIVLGDRVDVPTLKPGTDAAPVPEPDAARSGVVLWSSDHETGDWSAWEEGGPEVGGQNYWASGSGRVTSEISHTGTHSLEFAIDATDDSDSHGARVYRRVEPVAAYYSAWFLIKAAHRVSDWWTLFLFHARDASFLDVTYLWDIRLVTSPAEMTILQFFDHDTGQALTAAQNGVVPVNQWFHLEAYLDYQPPDATRLRVWLNGLAVFERSGLHTATEENVFWVVGNGGSGLEPTTSTVYVDDAAVATARLGR